MAAKPDPPTSPSTSSPQPSQSRSSAPIPPPSAQVCSDDDDGDESDDLDDVLDDFTPTLKELPNTTTPSAKSGTAPDPPSFPFGSDDLPPGVDQEQFEKELRAQMEAVFKDLDDNPEMQEELSALLGNIGALAVDGPEGERSGEKNSGELPSLLSSSKDKPTSCASASASGSAPPKAAADSAFEEQILRAMNRMQQSGEQATAAVSQAGEDDILLELLKSLEGSGDGADGNSSFATAISNMMSMLLAKDILYEPMVELNQKFPTWLAENGDKISKEDKERYTMQRNCVKAIVDRFEQKGYSDDNPEDKAFIQAQMDKMQAAGSPPSDLVDEGAVQEILQQSGGVGCPVQ